MPIAFGTLMERNSRLSWSADQTRIDRKCSPKEVVPELSLVGEKELAK